MGKRALKKSRAKSPKFWFFICLAVLVLVFIGIAAWVVPRALQAKDELQKSIPLATQVQKQLLAGDMTAARKTGAELSKHTSKAHELTNDGIWRGLEWIPFVGPNLSAVREISASVDDLTQNALVPATGLSMDAFKIKDGRVDIQSIRNLVDLVGGIKTTVVTADDQIKGIDRGALIDQVSDGVKQLIGPLGKARDAVDGIDAAVKVLPGALGGDGARNYLLLFQNNAESRATGGNPGTFAVLNANDGALKITEQASGSSDFENNRATPVSPVDPQTKAIYSDIIAKWTSNITQTPDFPTTATYAKAYWKEFSPSTKIDGVLSIDPVALSYMLEGTGPVKLQTGDVITSKNAVSMLMNKIYFRSSDYRVLDAFFGSAATSMFDALASGKGDPKKVVEGAIKATDEGRILFWSDNAKERAVIGDSRLAGTLPTSNAKQTVIGAYLNDVTGAKMDYYLKMNVDASTQCTADAPTFAAKVTLKSDVPADQAYSLPAYITGPWYKGGSIGTDVVLYGPVGGKILSWQVDGKTYPAVTKGTHLGRPVVRIKVKNTPGQTVVLSYKMSGPKGSYGPLEVRTTPMTGKTPVTVESKGCN